MHSMHLYLRCDRQTANHSPWKITSHEKLGKQNCIVTVRDEHEAYSESR
jgi:hypothetical protein